MDFVSPLIELINNGWVLARKPLGYVCNLRDNVNSLRKANEKLKAQSGDVRTWVESRERGGGVQRKNEVAEWLGDVREFEVRVDQVLREAEGREGIRCLSRCLPQYCCSSYRLGKKVDQMLTEARDLQKKKGEFGDLTLPLSHSQVKEMPMDKTVGLDTSLDEVWKWLVDQNKGGVIGLYGLGGVGKTTLMKKINERISRENPGFQVVIWVMVSRQASEEAIRDTIRKRLGIEDQIWSGWSPEIKVHHLCQALTAKKFLLMLDDLWQWLDLSKIGVPRGLENGSKIVFTTREKQICAQMGADKTSFEVRCLTTKEAMELFEKSVGQSTLYSSPDILELAKDTVEECKGLPLALVAAGRAMAGVDNLQEWEFALATLRNNPHKFSGMDEVVYHVLELSYNRLYDSKLQRCFLYCCLFPNNYHMRPHDLIGLWIGEGLLRDADDVYSLRIEGESILGRLNRACLLESGHDDYDNDKPYVKMQDVMRNMALWIARDHGQKENKWLVIEREEDLSAKMISKWVDVEKVSIWGEWIVNINQIPFRCSQLKTLIIRETFMKLVPRGFFDLMAACLTVLDLSDNKYIESFPVDVCTLINLEYLNVSGTCIQELPRDIDKLTHLRWLLLESMKMSILIPIGAITSLPLSVLSMWKSWWSEKEEEMEKEKEEEVIEKLGGMQHLADLSIRVYKSSSVEEIFQFPNLQKSIRRVEIQMCQDLKHVVVRHSLLHLEILNLENCPELVQMKVNDGIDSCFPSLTEVRIVECGLSDLSWLVHAPKLRELTVVACRSMEKIIGDGIGPVQSAYLRLFSHLNNVRLWELTKLTSICDQALSFSPAVKFQIAKCPKLGKLPLGLSSARGGGFSVKGDGEWWAKFEWDPSALVTARVTCQLEGSLVEEEMTYREARRKALTGRLCRSQRRMKDEPDGAVEIRFLPHGPSE